jgi:hypothetical protein
MEFVVYCPSNMDSTMVASARIARWLAKQLPGKVWAVDGRNVNKFDPPLDYVLFMVNAPPTMIPKVKHCEELIRKASTYVYVQNDYTIEAPTPVTYGKSLMIVGWTDRIAAGKPTWVWSTCRDRCEKYSEIYHYINWNALTYQDLNSSSENRVDDSVLYFGAYRKGRHKDFDRYMHTNDLFIISGPSRATSKFKEKYGFTDDRLLDVMQIPDDLTKYAFTLYIEDDMSHRQYHSPANRFYEALSANMAILVDRQAVGTLRKAGYNVPMAAIVDSPATVRRAMGYREQILSAQKAWRTDPKTGLPHDQAVLARFKELLATLS